jgi:His-Xaa-Ser system protein HxsD
MKLVIDPKVYSFDAVKKAAYRFLDRFAPQIYADASGIVCTLTFPAAVTEAEQELAAAEFWKELIDQDLREPIGKETASIRNAILAVAFSPVTERRD